MTIAGILGFSWSDSVNLTMLLDLTREFSRRLERDAVEDEVIPFWFQLVASIDSSDLK